jgi:hypothetical protein
MHTHVICTHRQTDGKPDRWTDRHTHTHTQYIGAHTYIHTYRIDRCMYVHTRAYVHVHKYTHIIYMYSICR